MATPPARLQGPAGGRRHRADQSRRADRHHHRPAAGRITGVPGHEDRRGGQAGCRWGDAAEDRGGHRQHPPLLVGAQGACWSTRSGTSGQGRTSTTAATSCAEVSRHPGSEVSRHHGVVHRLDRLLGPNGFNATVLPRHTSDRVSQGRTDGSFPSTARPGRPDAGDATRRVCGS